MTMLCISEMTHYRRRHSYAFILTPTHSFSRALAIHCAGLTMFHTVAVVALESTRCFPKHGAMKRQFSLSSRQQTNIFRSLNFDITYQNHTTEE